jgi:hypothetical protein
MPVTRATIGAIGLACTLVTLALSAAATGAPKAAQPEVRGPLAAGTRR